MGVCISAKADTFTNNVVVEANLEVQGETTLNDDLDVYGPTYISTTQSLFPLQVSSSRDNNIKLQVVNTHSGSDASASLRVDAKDTHLSITAYGNNSSSTLDGINRANSLSLHTGAGTWKDASFLSLGTGTSVPMYLFTGSEIRLTITGNGAVGIGTKTPQSLLHVAGNIIADPPTATNHVVTLDYAMHDLRIPAQGDISMGSYTNGPTPPQ
jgi:hypothetical protein